MEVVVRGKNVEVTEALRNHATRKLRKLSKYFDQPPQFQATAVLSVEKERQIVEVTVPLEGGRLLRGEEATSDMYASLDLVLDKLEKQLEKVKARRRRIPASGPALEASNASFEAAEAEDASELVKRKTFPKKPMTLEEALLQMELLGHSFFAFANADTDVINVLYRRRDGNFGLLEPR